MPHDRKIVMLVDDDEVFLSELQESLALTGYVPVPAGNGRDAVKIARRIIPDVILLDLKLGAENGFTVAARIRKYPATARIPVIMMSGFFNEQEHSTLLAPSSVNIYLKKPFTQKDVVMAIQTVLSDQVVKPFDPLRQMVEKSRRKAGKRA